VLDPEVESLWIHNTPLIKVNPLAREDLFPVNPEGGDIV
jgi:hypothetical protein